MFTAVTAKYRASGDTRTSIIASLTKRRQLISFAARVNDVTAPHEQPLRKKEERNIHLYYRINQKSGELLIGI